MFNVREPAGSRRGEALEAGERFLEARISRLESRLDELTESLAELAARLARVEGLAVSREAPAAPAPAAESAAVPTADETAKPSGGADFTSVVAFVGRTLLCLAGAYVPRALTSEGLLPQALGVAAGLAYAGLWIFVADRAGQRGRTASAGFHGTTAAIVALPLIWETTARFRLLSPAAGAAALAVLAVLSLLTAGRHGLRWPAWIISVGAGLAALWLGGQTHAPVPYAAFLVLLGVAGLWLAEARPWRALPWVTGGFAHLAVLMLWAESPIQRGEASVAGVMAVQLAHFVLYAGSCAAAARRGGRQLTLGACLHAAFAALAGYGGAVAVAAGRPTMAPALGAASLFFAAALYVLALAVVARERKLDVQFYAGLAVPLVLGGSHLLLARPALLWASGAILSSWFGNRLSRLTLSAHAVVYALAAVLSSGLFIAATHALAGSAAAPWPPLTAPGLLALAALLACLALPVRGDVASSGRVTRVPKLALLLVAVWAGCGVLIALAAPPVAGQPGAGADPAVLAAVRTAVLALASLALAWTSRGRWLREARWLVYPVLVLGGVKLLIEDFPAGRPETLLVALALYGGALILAPRLGRPAR